jgi:hypothetical protein
VLVLAERMVILTGRDDEFVLAETLFWEALRLGEGIGMEKQYHAFPDKPGTLRVQWQLTEIEGRMVRRPPKDDSYGNPDMPPFMRRMLDGQVRRVPSAPEGTRGGPETAPRSQEFSRND